MESLFPYVLTSLSSLISITLTTYLSPIHTTYRPHQREYSSVNDIPPALLVLSLVFSYFLACIRQILVILLSLWHALLFSILTYVPRLHTYNTVRVLSDPITSYYYDMYY